LSRLLLFGIISLSFVLLFGCSSNSHTKESNIDNEQQSGSSMNEDSSKMIEPAESGAEEEQESSSNTDSLTTSQGEDSVSLEEMELLKETLRTYIFDEYMKSSDYVYAKGVNWSERFYDNLTAEEIWNVIEEYKKMNTGEEGTLFDQALYLTVHAPIKDNWKELFLEDWYNGSYSADNEIETMIDKGDSVWIYTKQYPYTGKKDNYPIITLFKNTGNWHG
jgi:hypothetical protein